MKNVQELQKQRFKMYDDFYHNIIPERVPMKINLPPHLLAEYDGQDRVDFQYDFSKLYKPAMALGEKIYADEALVLPVSLIFTRPPSFYQALDSQSFVMGENGMVQHPEVSAMNPDEYEALIEDPFAFLVEKVVPRQYKNIDWTKPVETCRNIEIAKKTLEKDGQASMPMFMEMIGKFGYYPGAPVTSLGFSEAPCDFIADQLRGFSGVSMDIRRQKENLKRACEAVMPLLFYFGLPDAPHPEGSVITPLHMPTFMREKDFEEIWLPSYKTLTEQWASLGVRTCAFCEDDWTRYLDLLLELPAGTHLMFEYGDMQKIKDKLGKKFIIEGLYPLSLLKNGTQQECVDKAKEILDIMAPGGGYIFGFDKMALTLGDINLENLAAVTDFVREYGKYDNAGESFGMPLNSEKFVFDKTIMPPLKSRYSVDWSKYEKIPEVGRKRLEKEEKSFFDFIMNMLI